MQCCNKEDAMAKLTKEEKIELAIKMADAVVLQLKITKILEEHPNGLKAREISELIPNTDKKTINQTLYSSQELYQVCDYVWSLKKQESKVTDPEVVKKDKIDRVKRASEFSAKFEKIYGKKEYLSTDLEKKILSISNDDYALFLNQLHCLNNDDSIPKAEHGYCYHPEIDAAISLALLSEEKFQEIVERSKKLFLVYSGLTKDFNIWKTIVTAEENTFKALFRAAERVKGIVIYPNIDVCNNWYRLISKLSETKNYKRFLERNEIINNAQIFRQELTDYSIWQELAFMNANDFNHVTENLPKLLNNKDCRILQLSNQEILRICTNDRFGFEYWCSKLSKFSQLIENNSITIEYLKDNWNKKNNNRNNH